MYNKEYLKLKGGMARLLHEYEREHDEEKNVVFREAINGCIALLDDVWEVVDAARNDRIPHKNGPEYRHNESVYGEELVGYCGSFELHDGNPNCKHEVYFCYSGGVKCIKCGAWYCV